VQAFNGLLESAKRLSKIVVLVLGAILAPITLPVGFSVLVVSSPVLLMGAVSYCWVTDFSQCVKLLKECIAFFPRAKVWKVVLFLDLWMHLGYKKAKTWYKDITHLPILSAYISQTRGEHFITVDMVGENNKEYFSEALKGDEHSWDEERMDCMRKTFSLVEEEWEDSDER
jgi:hypothetical protein